VSHKGIIPEDGGAVRSIKLIVADVGVWSVIWLNGWMGGWECVRLGVRDGIMRGSRCPWFTVRRVDVKAGRAVGEGGESFG
jgi:hypothetical protein